MKAALKHRTTLICALVAADNVHQPVFCSDSPRPTSAKSEFQRLRLANSLEGILHHSRYQIENFRCFLEVGFEPPGNIFFEAAAKPWTALNNAGRIRGWRFLLLAQCLAPEVIPLLFGAQFFQTVILPELPVVDRH